MNEYINGWYVVVSAENGGWVWNIYDSPRTENYGGTPEDCNMTLQHRDAAIAEAIERAESRGARGLS